MRYSNKLNPQVGDRFQIIEELFGTDTFEITEISDDGMETILITEARPYISFTWGDWAHYYEHIKYYPRPPAPLLDEDLFTL